jgi:hypothetical protein
VSQSQNQKLLQQKMEQKQKSLAAAAMPARSAVRDMDPIEVCLLMINTPPPSAPRHTLKHTPSSLLLHHVLVCHFLPDMLSAYRHLTQAALNPTRNASQRKAQQAAAKKAVKVGKKDSTMADDYDFATDFVARKK